jgi:hypothetical protein
MPSKDDRIDAQSEFHMPSEERRKLARKARDSAPSAVIMRLAAELGVTPESIAARLDHDTLRRTHYPVKATETADGRTLYE